MLQRISLWFLNIFLDSFIIPLTFYLLWSIQSSQNFLNLKIVSNVNICHSDPGFEWLTQSFKLFNSVFPLLLQIMKWISLQNIHQLSATTGEQFFPQNSRRKCAKGNGVLLLALILRSSFAHTEFREGEVEFHGSITSNLNIYHPILYNLDSPIKPVCNVVII